MGTKSKAKRFHSAKTVFILLLIVHYISLIEGRMMHFYRSRRNLALNNMDDNNMFTMMDPCTGQWASPFIMGLRNPCRPFCPPEPCWPSPSVDLGAGSEFGCRFGQWLSFDESREIWLSAPISSSLSWHRADALARAINGQLMDVHSVSDQEHLHRLLQCYPMDTSVWLGASDLAVKGEWEWSSGRGRVHLAFWGPKQQQQMDEEQHCLEMQAQSGLWYTANCQPREKDKWRAYVVVRYINKENKKGGENDENDEEYDEYSTSSSLTTTATINDVTEATTEEYSDYYYDEYDDLFVGTEPPPV